MTEYLIKHKDRINSKFGVEPNKRSIQDLLDKGVAIVDKDAGPTSHESADFLKKILGVDKAGHSGTLDPKVTGVLVCGLGRATRLMEYMLKSNKEYICLMYVHKELEKEKIEEALKKFTGKIMQTPPVVSAVKRVEREREIYYIDLLDFEGQNVLFRVGCQHGTYIRKLCSDLGEYLGCGAHMKELRRTKAGPFREEDGVISLDKLRNLYELYNETSDKEEKQIYETELRKYLKPMEDILVDYKKVFVRDTAVDYVANGSDLAIPGVLSVQEGIEMGETVVMVTSKGELIGIGMAFLSTKDVMKKEKGAFVKSHKIFMEVGYYPRKWDFKKENKEGEEGN